MPSSRTSPSGPIVNFFTAFVVGVYGAQPGAPAAVNRAAIQAAIDQASASGNGQVVFAPGVYEINARLVLKSDVFIFAPGTTIKLANNSNDFVFTVAAGASDINVTGLEIDGNKANNTTVAAGIQTTDGTGTRITFADMHVHDCAGDGMRIGGSAVKVLACTFLDNGVSGFSGDLLTYFTVADCYAARNGTHNIGLIGVCSYGVIDGNTCELSGVLADNLTGYAAGNSRITWSNNVSRLGGNNGVHVGGSYISFVDNIIEDANDYGLIVRNNDASVMPGFVGEGNIITNSGTNAGNSGVWLGNLADFVWANNHVSGSYSHGVLVKEACTRGTISGGTYNTNGGGGGSGSGLRFESSCTNIAVSGVTTCNNVSTGLRIQDSTNILVTGHVASGNSNPVTVDGASSQVRFIGNSFTGNTSDTPTITAGTVDMWADSPNGGVVNLASVAVPTLVPYSNYFRVTGAVAITSITASWVGRVATLRFTAAGLTMVTGGNLVIAGGTFTSAVNGTITLISDGVTWYEIGRMTP